MVAEFSLPDPLLIKPKKKRATSGLSLLRSIKLEVNLHIVSIQRDLFHFDAGVIANNVLVAHASDDRSNELADDRTKNEGSVLREYCDNLEEISSRKIGEGDRESRIHRGNGKTARDLALISHIYKHAIVDDGDEKAGEYFDDKHLPDGESVRVVLIVFAQQEDDE